MSHAVFSPSASKRWMACPGSFAANIDAPNTSSKYADDGTLAHDLAASLIEGTMKLPAVQRAAPSPEHAEAIAVYADFARGIKKSADWFEVESKVRWNDELFGTADLLAVTGDTMDVGDLKTGAGVYVDHVENSQMLTYAFLALSTIPRNVTQNVKKVNLHVIQPLFPGAQPIRTWSCPIAVVLEWGQAVQRAMEAAKQPNAPRVPGEEQCRWCAVKVNCPASQGIVSSLMQPALVDTNPEQLGEWLRKVALAESFIKTLRETAHKLVEQGVNIPGWKLEPKRATRKWADEKKLIAAAVKEGIDVRVQTVMSPAALEKHLKDKLPPKIEALVTAESSGYNLVVDKSYVPSLPKAAAPDLKSALRNLKHRV